MIPIGSHPALHPVMETLAYAAGYADFRWQQGRQGDVVSEPQRWTVLAAAAVGALVGSRLLGIAEQWPTVLEAWRTGKLAALLIAPGGKTIVGGLLGGWLGVEIAKRLSGIKQRTGDLFALPLCVGIAVGRVGCLLAGLADDTYGKPTSLPWAVNLGDGIGRHPVQVYEILFLALLAVVVSTIPVASSGSGHDFSHAKSDLQKSRAFAPQGTRFRIFLGSYLAWRIAIDFLKPQPLVAGMNLIQWCCVAGIFLLIADKFVGRGKRHETLRA
jgi:prolipoprotein diacylglyceryltransferase